jgi:hypothetical protein
MTNPQTKQHLHSLSERRRRRAIERDGQITYLEQACPSQQMVATLAKIKVDLDMEILRLL